MKYFIVYILALLPSCTLQQEQALEDFLEGEAQTAEKVISDLAGPPPANPANGPVKSY